MCEQIRLELCKMITLALAPRKKTDGKFCSPGIINRGEGVKDVMVERMSFRGQILPITPHATFSNGSRG